MAGLERTIADMQRQIAELTRRQANTIRTGRVVEVDPASGRVRVNVGDDGSELVTPFIPWPERAGARRSWNPPAVGEMMTVLSPGGEVGENSVATYGGFTADVPAPSGDGEAAVFAVGGVTITVLGDAVTVSAPKVTILSPTVELGGAGGKPVARVGDMVQIDTGSSAGSWPIIEGSSTVTAID